ncbi:DUF6334 family protein [Pontibacter flavimaris]|uniref:Uncharacterized protein n=1 Tax=Pontibacter flavimaris TaxID=1797110 RepID=A0A1Q5PI94_9BACT|nr:DUF6334 family protein [Pontibacter flavimaris]OKL41943.1 hypothetical protein A3841_08015 [Pontibacter flavimaris]
MESLTDLDALSGKEVTQALALHDLTYGWLEQVLFRVEEVWLAVRVNADTDEIILAILPELDTEALERQFSFTQIANQRKTIAWLRRMTNQYGYEDGFQLAFDDAEGTHVQLLAEASQLRLIVFREY